MSEQEWKSKCFSLEEVVAQRSKEIEALRARLNVAVEALEEIKGWDLYPDERPVVEQALAKIQVGMPGDKK